MWRKMPLLRGEVDNGRNDRDEHRRAPAIQVVEVRLLLHRKAGVGLAERGEVDAAARK